MASCVVFKELALLDELKCICTQVCVCVCVRLENCALCYGAIHFFFNADSGGLFLA